jgi:hypothetical protein
VKPIEVGRAGWIDCTSRAAARPGGVKSIEVG